MKPKHVTPAFYRRILAARRAGRCALPSATRLPGKSCVLAGAARRCAEAPQDPYDVVPAACTARRFPTSCLGAVS